MNHYVYGIDVGGTSIKCGRFVVLNEAEKEIELVKKWEIPTKLEEEGSHILQDISDTVKNDMNVNTIKYKEVSGVGVGVPGPVFSDGTVNRCINLGWGVFNAQEEFTKILGMPTKVANDANAAALGEFYAGAGKKYKNLVMVSLGTGVGSGIINEGQIFVGNNGAAGEIGHMIVNPKESEPCKCGNYGCLEQYVSARGVVDITKRLLENYEGETVLRGRTYMTPEIIVNGAKTGDKLATIAVDRVSEMLGIALSNVASVVNPEVFVIGGGISKAGNFLIDKVASAFRANAFHACADVEILVAELSNNAGIYGAALLMV